MAVVSWAKWCASLLVVCTPVLQSLACPLHLFKNHLPALVGISVCDPGNRAIAFYDPLSEVCPNNCSWLSDIFSHKPGACLLLSPWSWPLTTAVHSLYLRRFLQSSSIPTTTPSCWIRTLPSWSSWTRLAWAPASSPSAWRPLGISAPPSRSPASPWLAGTSWRTPGAPATRTTHCGRGWWGWRTRCCVRSSTRRRGSRWVSRTACSVPAGTPRPLRTSAQLRQGASQLCPSRAGHPRSPAGTWWGWSAGAMTRHAATASPRPSPKCCLLKTGSRETWSEPQAQGGVFLCSVYMSARAVWTQSGILPMNFAVPGLLISKPVEGESSLLSGRPLPPWLLGSSGRFPRCLQELSFFQRDYVGGKEIHPILPTQWASPPAFWGWTRCHGQLWSREGRDQIHQVSSKAPTRPTSKEPPMGQPQTASLAVALAISQSGLFPSQSPVHTLIKPGLASDPRNTCPMALIPPFLSYICWGRWLGAAF